MTQGKIYLCCKLAVATDVNLRPNFLSWRLTQCCMCCLKTVAIVYRCKLSLWLHHLFHLDLLHTVWCALCIYALNANGGCQAVLPRLSSSLSISVRFNLSQAPWMYNSSKNAGAPFRALSQTLGLGSVSLIRPCKALYRLIIGELHDSQKSISHKF